MRERYKVVADSGVFIEVDEAYQIIDRRDPDHPVCWCTDPNMASKVTTALNQQYRDGAERRAARKAFA